MELYKTIRTASRAVMVVSFLIATWKVCDTFKEVSNAISEGTSPDKKEPEQKTFEAEYTVKKEES